MIKLSREEMKSEGWDLIGGSVPLGSCPWRAVSCHHPFKYISCPPRNKELPLSLTPTNSWCSAQVHRAKGPWTELWNPQFRSIIPHVKFFVVVVLLGILSRKKNAFMVCFSSFPPTSQRSCLNCKSHHPTGFILLQPFICTHAPFPFGCPLLPLYSLLCTYAILSPMFASVCVFSLWLSMPQEEPSCLSYLYCLPHSGCWQIFREQMSFSIIYC